MHQSKTLIKTKSNVTSSQKMLGALLEEIRLLRHELMLLLPSEDLKDYAHPARIKHSYQKALKEYQPAPL